ncbi:DNA polymerase delta, subunit 4-domain-containing protein [Trametes punicea]|nr:DNA polymerase delta, subunit 4-domain-containing protein [Trametes punicea]
MPPRRNSRPSPQLKQAKLSFASKRNSSTAAAAAGKQSSKSSVSTRRPSRTSPSPTSAAEPIEIIDSESDASLDEDTVVPTPKKRRLDSSRRTTGVIVPAKLAPEQEKEKEPLDVSDRRWRQLYGIAREKMGNLQPVHAHGQSMVHHILRVFDLSYEYGPCVGISRLDRWERAHALGLNPPPEVKEILLTKEGSTDEQFTQSVFHGEV